MNETSPARTWLLLLLTLGGSLIVAVLLSRTAPSPKPAPKAPDAGFLPVLDSTSDFVVNARWERAVPESLRSNEMQAAPWAPGLRIHRLRGGAWEDRRAELEDVATGDIRAYAIGDLLPHGSLLVGISSASVQLLVADRELVALDTLGKVSSLERFEARAGASLRPAAVDPGYAAAVEEALYALGGADDVLAQAAVDALIAAGDPVIDHVIRQVDSAVPLPPRSLQYGNRSATVSTRGQAILLVLEAITGQNFGDPLGPDAERTCRAWLRWWGAE